MRHSTPFSLMGNITWSWAAEIFRILVFAGVGFYLVRHLGPERYGHLSFSLGLILILRPLSGLGLAAIVTKRLVRAPERREVILGSAAACQLAGALSSLALVIVLAWLLSPDPEQVVLTSIMAFGLPAYSLNVLGSFFVSRHRIKRLAQANIIHVLALAGLRMIFILNEAELGWFALVIALEGVVMNGPLLWFFWREGNSARNWRPCWREAKGMLSEGAPLFLASLAIVASNRLDQILVMNLIGPVTLGFYAAAVMVSETWMFLPRVLLQVSTPVLLGGDPRQGPRRSRMALLLMTGFNALGVTVSIVTLLLSPWVIPFLFGDRFQDVVGLLQVHIWSGMFFANFLVIRTLLIADRRQWLFLAFVMGEALLNLGLNFALIPVIGVMGAAWSALASRAAAVLILPLLRIESRPKGLLVWRSFTPASLRGFLREAPTLRRRLLSAENLEA